MFLHLYFRGDEDSRQVPDRSTLSQFWINLAPYICTGPGDMATEHINGNGTDEPVESSVAVTHSEHFQTLLDAGLPRKVAVKLDEIYIAGETLRIFV